MIEAVKQTRICVTGLKDRSCQFCRRRCCCFALFLLLFSDWVKPQITSQSQLRNTFHDTDIHKTCFEELSKANNCLSVFIIIIVVYQAQYLVRKRIRAHSLIHTKIPAHTSILTTQNLAYTPLKTGSKQRLETDEDSNSERNGKRGRPIVKNTHN